MGTRRIIGIANRHFYPVFCSIIFVSVAIDVQGLDHGDGHPSTPYKPTLVISYGFGSTKILLSSDNSTSRAKPVVLNSSSKEIRIECEATFPIDLTFDGHRTNRGFSTEIRRNDTTFSIVATTSALEEATGNYSCFSAGHPQNRSSFYIYVAPAIPPILLNRGKTIVVQQPTDVRQRIIIPCPTSKPQNSSLIGLFMKNEDNENGSTEWEQLISTSYRYDPTIGFFLENNNSNVGTFKCLSSINAEDKLEVIVKPYKVFRVTPNQERWTFKENETFKGKCESSNNISIRSTNVRLKVVSNSTVSTDAVANYILEFETEALNKSNHNQQISCETVNGGNDMWFWILQLNNGSQVQRGRNSAVMDACSKFHHGVLKFYECNSWVECQMRRCQKFDHKCDTNDESRNVPDGILQCLSNFTEPVSLIYFKGLSTNNVITDWTTAPQSDVLTLIMRAEDTNNGSLLPKKLRKPSKAIKFICQGSRFVFAPDFVWKVSVKTAKGSVNDTIISGENVNHIFGKTTSVISSEYAVNALPKHFIEISCEARIWNTTGSRTVKISSTEVLGQTKLSSACRILTKEALIFAAISIVLVLF